MDYFLLISAICGLTTILIHGKIMTMWGIRPLLNKINFIKELTNCSMCIGTWIGAFYGIGCHYIMEHHHSYFIFATLPFASSAWCFLYERIVVLLDDIIQLLDVK